MFGNRENFRAISGFLKYEVSNHGRVRNVESGKVLKPRELPARYQRVYLYKNGVGKDYYIHRLVACEFFPNPKNLPQVDHIDGNPRNNNADNLRWCSASDNNRNQKKRSGTSSIYKGVCWDKKKKKWQVATKVYGKLMYLGLFACEKEAGQAYNDFAIKHFKEFTKLNEIIESDSAEENESESELEYDSEES